MGNRFLSLDGFAVTAIRGKNHAVERQPIDKLKMEFAPLGKIQRGDAQLLLGLTDRGFQGSLPGLQPTTWAIDLSRSKTAFLADHEDLPTPANKAERGPHCRLPVLPKGGVVGIHCRGIYHEEHEEWKKMARILLNFGILHELHGDPLVTRLKSHAYRFESPMTVP